MNLATVGNRKDSTMAPENLSRFGVPTADNGAGWREALAKLGGASRGGIEHTPFN